METWVVGAIVVAAVAGMLWHWLGPKRRQGHGSVCSSCPWEQGGTCTGPEKEKNDCGRTPENLK